LSEDLATKRPADAARADKNTDLELLVNAQALNIAELEAACTNLKLEKENLMTSYWKLLEKHKILVEKAELEKAEITEVHAAEVAKINDGLDKETQDYTDYHLNVRHRLRTLHDVVASSFGEVNAWCFPFPARNVKVEDLINWVGEEVKAMPRTLWQLNDNFVVVAVEGVLNMLQGTGYPELPQLRELAASSNVSIVEDIPADVQRLAGRLIRKWWKNHGLPEALHRLDAGNTKTVSSTGV
jgi:hypothetical protein